MRQIIKYTKLSSIKNKKIMAEALSENIYILLNNATDDMGLRILLSKKDMSDIIKKVKLPKFRIK